MATARHTPLGISERTNYGKGTLSDFTPFTLTFYNLQTLLIHRAWENVATARHTPLGISERACAKPRLASETSPLLNL